MAKYVTGEELRERILNVMAGQCPRICVAFLGPNWVDQLFNRKLPQTAKVICDLQMGATVRAALEAGGAPDNKQLRHLPGYEMHAKVYLSEEGAVVSSANATGAALSGDKRIEDGIWVTPGSAMHREISRQFKERYDAAVMVDRAAFDEAPICAGSPSLRPGNTLIEALRQNVNAFYGIYFVCSTVPVDRAIREATDIRIAEDEEDLDPAEKGIRSDRRELFANWDTAPADWPALFFSVFRGPRGGLYLSKNDSPRFFEGVKGADGREPEDVFVSRMLDWDAAGPRFGGLPRLASRSACQDELKATFATKDSFECFDGKILTGNEFLDLCLKIDEA